MAHPTSEPERRICSSCESEYLMTAREINWFLSRQLQIPRHCQVCRKRRRAEAAVKEATADRLEK